MAVQLFYPKYKKQIMHLYSDHYPLLIVLVGTAVLGGIAGTIGAFALVRKQSLLGDAIAHACLPGIALAFLFTQSTHPLPLLAGAMISGAVALCCIHALRRITPLKLDAILGSALSVFFGFGLVCITIIQKYPIPHQALLTNVIFGSAATIFAHDIITVGCIAALVLGGILALWKECKLIAFDSSYAQTLGYPVHLLDYLLTLLILITIAIGLHMVGVILMSTMLVAPAATARLVTQRFSSFVISSALCGIAYSVIGTLISSQCNHMPTGPVIAVVAITSVLTILWIVPWIRNIITTNNV
jgi:manganese/zinc/iron transport system permease protein